MKLPHVLWVSEDADVFLPLFEAVRAEGLRAGWLELEAPPALASFDRATGAGALRAVAVGDGRAVSLKRHRGTPVLGDLIREFFLGCSLVLVRGNPLEAPARVLPLPPRRPEDPSWWRLVPGGEGASWTLESANGDRRQLEPAALAKRLRRPRLD
ncbi:MAG TPA: hypothetical protein VNB06_01390 [Thermoanaerobaculia bacterium]|nr:hypothetical protein [Thermoanaerobaculia bacterium]